MASPRIKATYSLDVETAAALEQMARRWNVSKSEALRRAIWTVASEDETAQDALSVFEQLQQSVDLSPEAANEWQAQVEQERQTFGTARKRSRT